MSEQKPFLTKKHYLIIFLILLGAGLLGASPSLFDATQVKNTIDLSTQPDIDPTESIISNENPMPLSYEDEQPLYTYVLMLVMRGHDYTYQSGVPVYISNFAHMDTGCNWMGVAGQIFDKAGNPVNGQTVTIEGIINGVTISLSGISGESLAYGPGGYEIKIADEPFASAGALLITLRDKHYTRVTLPEPLTTYADCTRNLVIVNFVSIH